MGINETLLNLTSPDIGTLLSQELVILLAALIAVVGGYVTLLINEKNKRVFHLIEQTWNLKQSLFSESISEMSKLVTITIDNLILEERFLESDDKKVRENLCGTFQFIKKMEGNSLLSEEEIKKIINGKSNLSTENLKLQLKSYYTTKKTNCFLELNKIKLKLHLLLIDFNIWGDIGKFQDFITESVEKTEDPSNFSREEFYTTSAAKENEIIDMMRMELSKTLDLKSLKDFKIKLE